MNPVLPLVSAVHANSGQLPAQLTGSLGDPGALPADMPAPGGGDKQVARTAAQHLVAAIRNVSDPALKATFTQALSSLHSYLAQDSKAEKAGLAKKAKPPVKDAKPPKKTV